MKSRKSLESRENIVVDRLLRGCGQPLLVCVGERRRDVFEWFVKSVLSRILPVHAIQLSEDLLADHLGQHDVILDSLPHQADVLVHVGGEVAHAAQPVVVVLDGFEAQGVDRAFNRLDALESIGANQIPPVMARPADSRWCCTRRLRS